LDFFVFLWSNWLFSMTYGRKNKKIGVRLDSRVRLSWAPLSIVSSTVGRQVRRMARQGEIMTYTSDYRKILFDSYGVSWWTADWHDKTALAVMAGLVPAIHASPPPRRLVQIMAAIS
jgi:hypothetical protein